MKTTLLTTLSCVFAFSAAQAQLVSRNQALTSGKSAALVSSAGNVNQNKSNTGLKSLLATCTDKVTYVDRHNTGNPAGDYLQVGGHGPYAWDAAMQSFPYYSGQITRIDFKAQSYSGSKTVQASIHALDATYTPTGSPLGSVNVTINATLAEYGGNLATPVTIPTSGYGFAVVIWDISGGVDSVKIMSNANGSGDNTGYSNAFYSSTIYNLLNDFGLDIDFLLRPTIKFNPPTPSLNASPTTLCVNATVSFSPNSIAYPGFYNSYVFNPSGTTTSLNFGDATSPSSNPYVNHAYTASGTFSAQLTETYIGWTATCPSDPSSQTITVNPAPTSFFGWSATQLAVTFTNLCTNASTYAWMFGDAGTSAAPNPVHNYAASGTYTVELTATGACGSDYFSTNISITDSTNGGNTGIQSIEQQMHVGIYPNPTENYFNIQMESVNTEDIYVEILSPLGQVISSRKFGYANSFFLPVDLSAYATGTYFVRITQGNVNTTRPVFKK